MFDFNFFKSSVAKIGAQLAALERDLEKARRRREDLRSQPVPTADLVAGLERWVDEQAALYPAALQKHLKRFTKNPHELGDLLSPNFHQHLPLLTAIEHIGVTGSPTHMQRNLCFFFPEEMKAGIRRALEGMRSEGEGPPLKDREAELAKLELEIPRLENEIETLVNTARDAGLNIERRAWAGDPRKVI